MKLELKCVSLHFRYYNRYMIRSISTILLIKKHLLKIFVQIVKNLRNSTSSCFDTFLEAVFSHQEGLRDDLPSRGWPLTPNVTEPFGLQIVLKNPDSSSVITEFNKLRSFPSKDSCYRSTRMSFSSSVNTFGTSLTHNFFIFRSSVTMRKTVVFVMFRVSAIKGQPLFRIQIITHTGHICFIGYLPETHSHENLKTEMCLIWTRYEYFFK